MENTGNKSKPEGNGSIITGIILISIGGLYLLKDYFPDIDFRDLWPYILIVIGVFLLVKGLRTNK